MSILVKAVIQLVTMAARHGLHVTSAAKLFVLHVVILMVRVRPIYQILV